MPIVPSRTLAVLVAVCVAPAFVSAGAQRGTAAVLHSPRAAVHRSALPSQLLFMPTDQSAISIYSLQDPQSGPVATIEDLPGVQQQTAVDANGDLFVANETSFGDGTQVDEFAPPYDGAPTVLNTTWLGALFAPIGVAVDASGTVYVSNCGHYCGETVTGIFVYPAGATAPASVITSPNFNTMAGMGTDPAGDLFVVNWNDATNADDVYEVPAGSRTPRDLKLRGLFGSRLAGVAFDPSSGDLFVSNPAGGANFILEYKPGKHYAFRQIALKAWFIVSPLMINIGPDDNLYAPINCATTCPQVVGFKPGAKKPFEAIGSEGVGEVPSVATYPNIELQGSRTAQRRYWSFTR